MISPAHLKRKIKDYFRSKTDYLIRSVIKNSSWAIAGQSVNAGVMLVETLLLARFLSMQMFGMLIILISATELVFGLLGFRTGEAVIKYIPEIMHNQGKKAVSSFLHLVILIDGAASFIGFCIVIILSFFFVELIGLPTQYTSLLIILGVGSALKTAVRSVGSYLRVTDSFVLSIKLGIIAMLSRLIIVLTAIIIAPEISVISWAFVLSHCVFFILMFFAAVRSFRSLGINPLTEPIKFIPSEKKSIITFLLNINLAGTLRILSTKLDVIIIAALSSQGIVALYKVATRIASSLLLISDSLLIAIFPEISKLHAKSGIQQMRKMLIAFTKSLTLFAALTIISFAFFGEWILRTLAGEKYVESYLITLIMLIGTSFAMVFFWARPLLLVYGKASKLTLAAIVALLIQIGCLYMFVPRVGALGASLAFSLYYLSLVSLFMFLLSKSSNIPMFKRKLEYVNLEVPTKQVRPSVDNDAFYFKKTEKKNGN